MTRNNELQTMVNDNKRQPEQQTRWSNQLLVAKREVVFIVQVIVIVVISTVIVIVVIVTVIVIAAIVTVVIVIVIVIMLLLPFVAELEVCRRLGLDHFNLAEYREGTLTVFDRARLCEQHRQRQ